MPEALEVQPDEDESAQKEITNNTEIMNAESKTTTYQKGGQHA
jgi:hypothetical protein